VGADALAVLRTKIEVGLRILNDPDLKRPARRAEKEAVLWQLAQQLFDYRAMSRLVLASRWHDFSPRQQDDFVSAFAGFLRRAYMPRLLERYNGETLHFEQQRELSPSRAEVAVFVLWNGRKIPFSVNMIKRQGDWKIYDVRALGVSAIQNYRAQFRWLLLNDTPDQLIARLNARANPAS
jgi:phospholipid transport system substrate-binding protein